MDGKFVFQVFSNNLLSIQHTPKVTLTYFILISKTAKKEIYNRFNRKLKELSIKTKHIAGKWFFFLPPSEVNEVWKTITRGYLNGGALVRAGSVMAKVTSSLADDYKVYCISVYCEDSFDKSKVKKLLDALINDCGLVPSSYKVSF